MDFASFLMPGNINWFCNITAFFVSLYVLLRVDWLKEYRKGVFNVWIMSVFCIGLIRMLRAMVQSGINIHLSGAMLMTLLFGWRLGVLGMSLVCVLISLWGNSLSWNLGISLFIYAYFSISFCYLFFMIIEAFLPRNLYIYLFVTSFFGAAINFVITGTFSAFILWWQKIYSWSFLTSDYLPFYYLLSFGEGFMTCGLITILVVYRPQWVYTFRDERYLNGK